MAQIKVLALQSFLDLSIQYTGSVLNAFAIAEANNRSVTDNLVNGELLTLPEGLNLLNKELQYYQARNIIPATGQHFYSDNVLPGDFPYSL